MKKVKRNTGSSTYHCPVCRRVLTRKQYEKYVGVPTDREPGGAQPKRSVVSPVTHKGVIRVTKPG